MVQLLDDRPERTSAVIGRALIVDPGVRLGSQVLQQSVDNARLADPRLADQKDALTLTRSNLPPALLEQAQFLITADHRQHIAGSCLVPAFHRPLPGHREGPDRVGEALQILVAQVFQLESVAQQPACRFADGNLPWPRDRLQTGGKVRGFTDHRMFL